MDSKVVSIDPDVLGGMPVFRGTRVSIGNLFDYLEAGDSFDEFLQNFPTVQKEQVIVLLQTAREKVTVPSESS